MKKRKITDHLLALYKMRLTEDEKSKATVEKYMRDIYCFCRYIGERTPGKALVLAYKEHLREEYAIRSANSMLAAVNSFFRFAGWQDLCVKQFKLQRDTYCSEEKELSKGEYTALVNAAKEQRNERLSLLIQTICATGIRVSELQYITVEAIQKGEAVVCCKGKTRKVFIVSSLRNKLIKYIKKQRIHYGAVFVTKNGCPLNRSNIWREMKQLCKRAGVSPSKVFPHNLRHLFARTFYGIEKDIVKLADILGHSSVNTTRIYVMTTGIEHKRRMETMHLII